jgi:hypothetical protein
MHVLRGLVATSVLLLSAVAQERTADLAKRVLEEAECQTELPGGGDGAGGGIGGERRGVRESRRSRDSFGFDGVDMGSLAHVLLWGVVAAAVVMLGAAIVRHGGAGAARGRTVATVRTATAVAEAPRDDEMPDHERFAAAGDFASALRAVLQCAFFVSRAATDGLPAHATARELLRRLRGRPVPTEPLARLVETVELVHFGGRPADRAAYDGSRAHLANWEAGFRGKG